MKFILNLLLFITLFFTDSLLAFNSAIQSGIYGTNFKDSLLSNISSSTGNYLFNKAGDIGLITNNKDRSLTKTALHSLIGGSINAIEGESFIDGAVISGINELLSPLSKNLNKNEQILTSQLTGILTGALINSEAGAKQGYNLTTSAELNNRQLHQKEIEFINNKDNINKFKEYYKKQTNKSITDKEAMDLLLLSGKYMVNANDNGIINLQNNKFINMFNIFGKPEYSKDEINTAMGFLIDKSKGLKFEDKYLKPFTNEAPQQDYFTATKLQFYNNSYDPSNEFFESDTLATKLYAINNPYKYSHYSRNKFNKVSQQELDIISKGLLNHSDTIKLLQDKNNKDIKIKIGDWEVYPKDKSIYHQMGDKKNRNNVKLVNNDGREIVVRLTNDKYTIIDDNLNVGTLQLQ